MRARSWNVGQRRIDYVVENRMNAVAVNAWHLYAMRQAATIRRLLRGAHDHHSAVVKAAPTIDAMRQGLVQDVFVTRRFAERNPEDYRRVSTLAVATGARTIDVTGAAAFELDLVADGVGAILRRSIQ